MSETMTKMEWKKNYADDSGTKYAIRFDSDQAVENHDGVIELEQGGDIVHFASNEIDWMIDCLNKIKTEQGL